MREFSKLTIIRGFDFAWNNVNFAIYEVKILLVM
jgi:hypothetical protein